MTVRREAWLCRHHGSLERGSVYAAGQSRPQHEDSTMTKTTSACAGGFCSRHLHRGAPPNPAHLALGDASHKPGFKQPGLQLGLWPFGLAVRRVCSAPSPIRRSHWKDFEYPSRLEHTVMSKLVSMMHATKPAPPAHAQSARPVQAAPAARFGVRRTIQHALMETAISGAAAVLVLTVRLADGQSRCWWISSWQIT